MFKILGVYSFNKNIIMKKDDFGTRMKMYESQTTQTKLIPKLPVIARFDGHGFSKFTKGLKRPYDKRLSNLMVETAKYLCEKYNSNISYTQSDEISLIWYIPEHNSEMIFNGKLFKLQSLMASSASVFFNSKLEEYIPEKAGTLPEFDCRVWNVPNLDEAVNCILWREQDATKNSISMLAQSEFSHKQLHKKNSSDMQDMLMLEKNINWNDYPSFFKRGSYIQRKNKLTKFSAEELERLPAKHEARANPDLMIERNVVEILDLPPLSKISNKVDVIIFGKEVELYK